MAHFHTAIAIVMYFEWVVLLSMRVFPLSDSDITNNWIQYPFLNDNDVYVETDLAIAIVMLLLLSLYGNGVLGSQIFYDTPFTFLGQYCKITEKTCQANRVVVQLLLLDRSCLLDRCHNHFLKRLQTYL